MKIKDVEIKNRIGELENRLSFPFRVAAAVRDVWPETLPLIAAADLGVDLEWPDQYKRAKPV